MTEQHERMAADPAFRINDCALIAIATGRKAQNLKELRDHLQAVEASSLYYHFWGGLLRPGFESREYHNDFAEWVRHELRELALAERLAVVDPGDFTDLEALRHELVDIVDERLFETESLDWARSDRQFEFLRSEIVVFAARRSIRRPEALAEAVHQMSASSLFYHFIDARRRTDAGIDDFRAWIRGWGQAYQSLDQRLADLDPYFTSLLELRDRLTGLFTDYFGAAHG